VPVVADVWQSREALRLGPDERVVVLVVVPVLLEPEQGRVPDHRARVVDRERAGVVVGHPVREAQLDERPVGTPQRGHRTSGLEVDLAD
jgi:hypothetical protein